MMITEAHIDQAAAHVGNQAAEAYAEVVEQFRATHPVALGYVFSDGFNLLTEDERALLIYILLVLRGAYALTHGCEPPRITPEQISQAEETNWLPLVDNNERDFRKRLDPFFQNAPQEDVLAFFEDLLLDTDEGENITPAGKEYVFVAAKSVMDVWCGSK